jgi:hypothetical protein
MIINVNTGNMIYIERSGSLIGNGKVRISFENSLSGSSPCIQEEICDVEGNKRIIESFKSICNDLGVETYS